MIVSSGQKPPGRRCEPVWLLIRGHRQRLGHSQYELAELLVKASGNHSLTREDVARWERGKRIPGPYWRHWLSKVLVIPQDMLDAAARCGRKVRRRARPGDGDGAGSRLSPGVPAPR